MQDKHTRSCPEAVSTMWQSWGQMNLLSSLSVATWDFVLSFFFSVVSFVNLREQDCYCLGNRLLFLWGGHGAFKTGSLAGTLPFADAMALKGIVGPSSPPCSLLLPGHGESHVVLPGAPNMMWCFRTSPRQGPTNPGLKAPKPWAKASLSPL